MLSTMKLVFSNYLYVILASAVFIFLLIGLLIISQYIFLEPYLIGNIQQGSEFGFVLIVVLSALSGLVIPMNIYRINILKKSKGKISGSLFGSFIGSIAGNEKNLIKSPLADHFSRKKVNSVGRCCDKQHAEHQGERGSHECRSHSLPHEIPSCLCAMHLGR